MSKTVSRGQMFSVNVGVNDDLLAAMKNAQPLASKALQKGAQFWHDKFLPQHFEKSATQKYGYAPRSAGYGRYSEDPNVRRRFRAVPWYGGSINRFKAGKPDLVLSGSLRKDLTHKAMYRIGTGGRIDVVMSARVLNFVPNMPENSADFYIKQRNGKGYPNMKREIKIVTDDEREAIAQVVVTDLQGSFRLAQSKAA